MRGLNFLLSFSRSGSTLLHSHLGTHQDILTDVGEPNFLYRLVSDPYIQYQSYQKQYRMKQKEVQDLYNAAVREMVNKYYSTLAERLGNTVVLLKHPWITEYAHRLVTMFPESKIIYLIRHPYDTIASTYHFTLINEVAEKMFKNLDEIMRLYEHAVATMQGADVREQERKGNVKRIKYEDYINNTPSILKMLLRYLDVSAEDNVVKFIYDKVQQNEGHGVGSSISKSRIFNPSDKWNTVLSEAQRNRVRKRCGCFLGLFGYGVK